MKATVDKALIQQAIEALEIGDQFNPGLARVVLRAAPAEPAVEPQQTGKEYVDRLEAAEKDAARYRWMTANYKLWSWQPTRYNAAITSGFAFNDTGYSGYSFEDALTLAMKDEQK